MIPNTARTYLLSGIPGNISHDGPTRAASAIIDSADETENVFGRAFTYKTGTDTVEVGGTGAFAGILINPKAYAIDVTYARNGTVGEFATMAEINVQLGNDGNIGDPVSFDPATGIVSAGETGTVIPGAHIARHEPSAETPRLAVIALNGLVKLPTPPVTP
ncbi:hypothetical protein F1536_23225 [Achromobacter xylosoxidans]|uniref:structural cement protein Gp24 n=1 Tax=Alcaligenes xylosoxydans xylosoxydans TaxID=85698 RepID=UPI0012323DA1|nr:hypothetical protein [Achromobacter xylosoxidans]KAA5921353.1 hypothetical protein F1536_23225 [Achromobacter xylosoxidans]